MKRCHFSLFTSAAHLAALMTSVPDAGKVQIHLHPASPACILQQMHHPLRAPHVRNLAQNNPQIIASPVQLQPKQALQPVYYLLILANSEAETLSSCRRGAQI